MSPSLRAGSRFLITCAVLFPAAPVLADADAGPARLVADLVQGTLQLPPYISGFARLGNRAVFLGLDNEYYPGLWATDGTAQGMTPLGILCPSCSEAQLLGSTGNLAFYRTTSGYPLYEARIWRSDGTPTGTFPVTDVFKLPQSGSPALNAIDGGRLFFVACTPELGCEPWSSDGSPQGTAPVGEIVPGPDSATVRELAASGERAFLLVQTADGRSALWLANGAARSLKPLREVSQARGLLTHAGGAFFVAQDAGLEIWTSDGTPAGTRPVTHFGPQDPFGPWPVARLIDGRLYFRAIHGAHGFELWSVGARETTLRRLTDFADPQTVLWNLEKAGNRIVFVASQKRRGTKFWSTRGDLRSSAPFAACPGGCPSVVGPLMPVGSGRLAFFGRNRGDGFWVTDGTSAGTRLLKRSEGYREFVQAVAAGGRVLFQITNEYEHGELWITDGSGAGTFLAARGGPSWSHYYGWTGALVAGAANGRLLFVGGLGDSYGLWSSDGTRAGSRPLPFARAGKSSQPQRLAAFRDGLLAANCTGTVWELRFVRGTESSLLRDWPSQYCDSFGSVPVTVGDTAVFLVYREYGISLWRTDGTPEGTTALVPAGGSAEPEGVTRFGGQAAFWQVVIGPGGLLTQLWLTDGSPAGTRKLLDLPPGVEMYFLTGIGDKLYFFDLEEQENDFAWRPWVSDGTAAGTRPLTPPVDLRAADAHHSVVAFVELAGKVYFPLADGEGEVKVWRTDGTPEGTDPAITAAPGMRAPEGLTAAADRLYFAARRAEDPSGPLLPWVSDGTEAGTLPLADLALRSEGFAPLDRAPFIQLDDRVFFAASSPAHGDELWATDGTPEGTALVRDIAPGMLGSYPRGLVVWRDRLWFRARDGEHGMELWSSDGSAPGTRLVQDIAPGASWSVPKELTATEQSLYFSAFDSQHGRELWELPSGTLAGLAP